VRLTPTLRAAPFTFSLRDPGHGISFAIGEGDDGSPLLSYSVIHAFYQLPDGSKWAEHTDLYDVDDLRTAGKLAKLPFRQLTEGLRCASLRCVPPALAPLGGSQRVRSAAVSLPCATSSGQPHKTFRSSRAAARGSAPAPRALRSLWRRLKKPLP
jgi:hypothetical protein